MTLDLSGPGDKASGAESEPEELGKAAVPEARLYGGGSAFVRALQGAFMTALGLAIPVAIEPTILQLAHPYLLIAIGVVATVFQPPYNPTEGSITAQDKGTVVQIVWSIYLCNTAALVEAAWLRYPESFVWDSVAFVAFFLMLLGLFIRSWSVVVLGKFFSWNVRVQAGQEVVRSGPYRWIRHPSYTGAFLTYFFLPVFVHAWFSLLLAAVALPFAFARRIRHEDGLLRAELAGYEAYAKEVKAVIPGLL